MLVRMKKRRIPWGLLRLYAVGFALCVVIPGAPELCVRAAEHTTGPLQKTDFVLGLADVPLMPGLVQTEGDYVDFDTPESRIVESYARGKEGLDHVLKYYYASLPSLGWDALKPGQPEREADFGRGTEYLQIRAHTCKRTGDLHIVFRLRQQEKP